MVHHFDERRSFGAENVEVSPRLPSARLANQSIETPYVTFRFATTTINDVEVLTRLYVEATHPKVAGDRRVFDLSHILAEGYRRHPRTVEQIVDAQLSLESRIDALKTVAITFAGVREPLPALQEVVYGSSGIRSVDGLEPTFGIKNVVLTEFSDILRGYTRRAVTVVRNEEPWVQFHIIEREDRLCNACIVVMSTGLMLPLLDRWGHGVTEITLDDTIHDLTHLLKKVRYASELPALEAVANELTERLGRNPEAPRALKRRNFGHEVVLAARDGVLWAPESVATPSHRGEGTFMSDFGARELPDGRVLWARHWPRSFSSDVAFVVDSLEGARYTLNFHFPGQLDRRVARLFAKAVNGTRWPQFREMTELLQSVPRSGFGISLSLAVDSYPSAVNGLIRDLEQVIPDGIVERGLLPNILDRHNQYLPEILSELVAGRSPFYIVIDAEDPSACWHVQAFLDRDLKGAVFATNALGGSLVVSDNHFVGSADFRRTQLMKLFTVLVEDPDRLTQDPHRLTGLCETRRNLPGRSREDAIGYAAAVHGAVLVRDALTKEGMFPSPRNPRDIRWHTRKVREGMWVLSLIVESPRGAWSPSIVTVMGTSHGVVEITYSWGFRGPLGGLWGRRVRPSGEGGLSDDEISGVARVIGRGMQGKLEVPDLAAFSSVSSTIHATFLSSLRDVDPDREQKDILRRLWNVLKNIW